MVARLCFGSNGEPMNASEPTPAEMARFHQAMLSHWESMGPNCRCQKNIAWHRCELAKLQRLIFTELEVGA